MADVTLTVTLDGAEREVTLDDESLPAGLMSERLLRERFVPKTQLDTVRSGIDAEIAKALEGKFSNVELLGNEEALTEFLPSLVTAQRAQLLEILGVDESGQVDPQQIEHIRETIRKQELLPVQTELEKTSTENGVLRSGLLENDVLKASLLVGVAEGLEELLTGYYQERCVWSEEHRQWFLKDDQGRPDVAIAADRPKNLPPFRTVLDDLSEKRESGDVKTQGWFSSQQRDGIGYGGADESRGGPRAKPRSKMTDAEKSAYITEHGLAKFKQLPAEPPA